MADLSHTKLRGFQRDTDAPYKRDNTREDRRIVHPAARIGVVMIADGSAWSVVTLLGFDLNAFQNP